MRGSRVVEATIVSRNHPGSVATRAAEAAIGKPPSPWTRGYMRGRSQQSCSRHRLGRAATRMADANNRATAIAPAARLTRGRSHNREPQSPWVRGSRVAEATIVSRSRRGRAATQAAEADNWEAENHPWTAATQQAKADNWEAAFFSWI